MTDIQPPFNEANQSGLVNVFQATRPQACAVLNEAICIGLCHSCESNRGILPSGKADCTVKIGAIFLDCSIQ